MPRPTPEELDKAWDALTGDAARAYHAMWTFLVVPETSVALLSCKLRAEQPADIELVRRLIEDLDDPQFTVRDTATNKLKSIGSDSEAPLRRALDSKTSEEARRRIGQVLAAQACRPPT